MNSSSPLDSIRTPFRLHVVQDRAQAERAVAREVAELVRSRAANGQRTVLGFATGRTQQGVYAELVRLQREEGYRYATVVGFNLDEYVGVKSSDPCSFWHYMEQHFYGHVDVPAVHATQRFQHFTGSHHSGPIFTPATITILLLQQPGDALGPILVDIGIDRHHRAEQSAGKQYRCNL